MAVELAVAYISLVPSAKNIGVQLSNELGKPVTKAAKDASDEVGSTFGKLQNKLTDGFKGVGVAIAGAFVATKVVSFFKSSIDAASDLNESISKSRVVFGESSTAVEKFASTAAKNLGQSKQQATEAAATFGNLFVALGLGQRPAADMSTSIVKLASDLASFNNVRPQDALEAWRAALVGETEPMRLFGVNINQAALEQQALKDGLVKTVKDGLDPAAKAQAAYALILDQTKTAQGDFARTSDGLANQQRILAARTEDLKAKLGQALLPVMTLVVGVSADLAGFFAEHTELAAALGAVVGGVLVVAITRYVAQQAVLLRQKVAEFFVDAAHNAVRLKDAVVSVGSSLFTALGPVGLVAAGLAVLAIALDRSDDSAKKAGQSIGQKYVEATRGSVTAVATLQQRLNDLQAENTRIIASFEGVQQSGFSARTMAERSSKTYQSNTAVIKELRKELDDLKTQNVAVAEANRDGVAATQKASSAFTQMAQQAGISTDAAKALAVKLKIDVTAGASDANEEFFRLAERLKVANPATLALSDAISKLADKTLDASEKSKAFKDALDLLIGGNISAEKAVINLFSRLDELGGKLKENGANLDFRTQKGREDLTVIHDTVSAIRDHITSMQNAGASADDMRRALDGDTKAFNEQLKSAGFTAEQIAKLNVQYGLVPTSLNTVITADTTGAQLALDQLYKKAAEANLKIPFAAQDLVKLGRGAPRASGGPVAPGFVYPVGERGPEWFVPTAAGTIIPNAAPVSMPVGAGGERYAVIQIGDEVLIRAIKGYNSRHGTGWMNN